jgi:NAD(P)H-hydrate repair Nnr-like enzyme with NAD(P)H-hydrate dehydratase domain
MNDYWHKQGSKPLFPDLSWSRPENKQHAGKLLIVGGHAHGFAAPAEAYAEAEKAGIGVARVMLPDHLRSQLVKAQGTSVSTEFAPSTPSGSFASKALAELLDAAAWADGLLLAGDLGRNSETAIVLEKLVSKYPGWLVITKDAVDYFTSSPQAITARVSTCLVLTIAQLQKLAGSLKFTMAITFSMDLLQLVDALHELTNSFPLSIVVKHLDTLLVAHGGQVSTTKTAADLEDSWRVATAARVSVWLLQNPSKPFEALTTSLVSL